MIKVISCLVYDHDLKMVGLAAITCVLGSVLTTRLYARVRRSSGGDFVNWLFLCGLIGGATIWTTHFVAMLGFVPPMDHAYDPVLTLVSLIIAIVTTTLGMAIASLSRRGPAIEVGGAILGLGIAIMHYTGMAAFETNGLFQWDWTLVGVSIAFGLFLGALATSRIARPTTRYCRHFGAFALVLAICAVHFTGMGAVTIIPDPTVGVRSELISDGLMVFIVLTITGLIMAAAGSTYMIDVNASKVAASRYRHLAMHDLLTGLPNRSMLILSLNEIMHAGGKDGPAFAAIFAFNLNRFKSVNDVFSHAAGDQVLKTVADRICAELGEKEFLARVGGDEFVAIKNEVYHQSQARAFANRLTAAVSRPILWRDQTVSVTASVGVALYPDDGMNPDDLLHRADLAMSRAKSGLGQSICFYEPSMDEANRNRKALEIDLAKAIERDEFELYYQLQNDVVTRKVTGLEALLRWHHRERGMVSPADFIPVAEDTGFIGQLGEWVLRRACADAASWQNPLKIAVNVATAQLSDSTFPALVHAILLETGLPAARLELEVTESGIISDYQHALHVVRQLKALGVRIAMDDYGTGYSSLATLQHFPFDKIKIDRSFVKTVHSNVQSAAIVRSTIILANSLGIPVLAEGVEQEEHMKFLLAEGCAEAQGYLFGRPRPIAEFSDLVSEIPAPMAGTAGRRAGKPDTKLRRVV